jgi:hypothetical protein
MELAHDAKFFMTIFDVLRNVLTEVNIQFEEFVIRIQALDPQKSITIDTNIYGLNYYKNDLGTVNIGVFLPHIYRIFRGVHPKSLVKMRIEPEDQDTLHISFYDQDTNGKENESFQSISYYNVSIKSIELPVETINDTNVSYTAFTLDTKEFQRSIRNVSHLSEEMCVSTHNRRIFIHSAGIMGKASTELFNIKWLYSSDDDNQTERATQIFPVKYIQKYVNPRLIPSIDIWLQKTGTSRFIYVFDCATMSMTVAPIL